MSEQLKKIQDTLTKCDHVFQENEGYLKLFEKGQPAEHAKFKKSFGQLKTVMDLIAAKIKSKLKEQELPELLAKAEAVYKTLLTLKETLEPIARKFKAPAPAPPKPTGVPAPTKVPPPKPTGMPLTPSTGTLTDKLKTQATKNEPSFPNDNLTKGIAIPNSQKSPLPTKANTSPQSASKQPAPRPVVKDETWRSENATENQLKQRYNARKEKANDKITEIKKRIFNLKMRKFEMVWESMPKFIPKQFESWGPKILEETAKACDAAFTKHLSLAKQIEMNEQTKLMAKALMKNEVI